MPLHHANRLLPSRVIVRIHLLSHDLTSLATSFEKTTDLNVVLLVVIYLLSDSITRDHVAILVDCGLSRSLYHATIANVLSWVNIAV